MKYQGVIFDFSGTLFWDTDYHHRARDHFLRRFDITMPDGEN